MEILLWDRKQLPRRIFPVLHKILFLSRNRRNGRDLENMVVGGPKKCGEWPKIAANALVTNENSVM